MTASPYTEHLMGLTIHAENRLRDSRDWLCRHDVPDKSYIRVELADYTKPDNSLEIWCPFESYKAAVAWGWLHTKCVDARYGWEARLLSDCDSLCESGFIRIPLPDFQVILSFPSSTHPDAK